jgi:hypothetical protein
VKGTDPRRKGDRKRDANCDNDPGVTLPSRVQRLAGAALSQAVRLLYWRHTGVYFLPFSLRPRLREIAAPVCMPLPTGRPALSP